VQITKQLNILEKLIDDEDSTDIGGLLIHSEKQASTFLLQYRETKNYGSAGVEITITKWTLDDKTGPEAPLYVERV